MNVEFILFRIGLLNEAATIAKRAAALMLNKIARLGRSDLDLISGAKWRARLEIDESADVAE
eukprot:4923730-Pleurochrysis_carterae.AAC.6